MLSTGAVLHDWQFDWVADAVGPVPLQSISGGTDIIGCFVLGLTPSCRCARGRSQSRSLGLDVAALDERRRPVLGEVGELVCRAPVPVPPAGLPRATPTAAGSTTPTSPSTPACGPTAT